MKNKNTDIVAIAKNLGLNPTLALNKKRTISNLTALSNLHEQLHGLINETNALAPQELHAIQRNMSKIEAIEFQMQKEWDFELCRDKHTHWKRIKHCKCDKTSAVRHAEIVRVCPAHPT